MEPQKNQISFIINDVFYTKTIEGFDNPQMANQKSFELRMIDIVEKFLKHGQRIEQIMASFYPFQGMYYFLNVENNKFQVNSGASMAFRTLHENGVNEVPMPKETNTPLEAWKKTLTDAKQTGKDTHLAQEWVKHYSSREIIDQIKDFFKQFPKFKYDSEGKDFVYFTTKGNKTYLEEDFVEANKITTALFAKFGDLKCGISTSNPWITIGVSIEKLLNPTPSKYGKARQQVKAWKEVLTDPEQQRKKNEKQFSIDRLETVEQIKKIVSENSYLEYDYDDGDTLAFITRQNGNVESGNASPLDMKEARKIKFLLIDKFENISIDVDDMDEWVTLDIQIRMPKKKVTRSEKIKEIEKFISVTFNNYKFDYDDGKIVSFIDREGWEDEALGYSIAKNIKQKLEKTIENISVEIGSVDNIYLTLNITIY